MEVPENRLRMMLAKEGMVPKGQLGRTFILKGVGEREIRAVSKEKVV